MLSRGHHVDIDRVLARIDPDELLDRIDVNRLLDRVDVDRLLDRADVEALVSRSGVPDLVASSTSRIAGSLLDVVRRQAAGLDSLVDRLVDRALHDLCAGTAVVYDWGDRPAELPGPLSSYLARHSPA